MNRSCHRFPRYVECSQSASCVLRFAYIDQLNSLDDERAVVALRNALFCDIVGGIEVGRFDIETDAVGSHAGEYVIDLVAHDFGVHEFRDYVLEAKAWNSLFELAEIILPLGTENLYEPKERLLITQKRGID